MARISRQYASRGGEKLASALDAFQIDVTGYLCADFGSNVGGFVDCLLQRGAAKVYAIDTGYGELAWKLRKDPRVVVMERTNALYVEPSGQVDLVTIDMAWTPQILSIPAAAKWLKPGGRIVSLLKPHYESAKLTGQKPKGKLTEAQGKDICRTVCEKLSAIGWDATAAMISPVIGKGGNREFLLYFEKQRND